MDFDLSAYLAARRILVEEALARHLDALAGTPPALLESMRYSLLAGGKRLRPILALAACEAVGGAAEDALDAACALEFVHTYSLIHDDLPAMDNADSRRGRPTNHKVFGEAGAILAGDALLTEAFRVAATARKKRPEVVVEVLWELACAAGAAGMVGGQQLDIAATNPTTSPTSNPVSNPAMTLASLELLHRKKTGELLLVAVRAGARLGGASEEELARLSTYGAALGLAFQIVDDVLDATGDPTLTGKDLAADAEKTTFVKLLGEDGARARARQVMEEGMAGLTTFGARALPLRALGRYTLERDR